MNTIILVFIFLIGLCFGSFANVCIYRLPNNKSIINPPSSCPNCGQRIRAIELIPIISFIFLGGKCHDCKEKISIRYPFIELLMGILFILIFLKYNLGLNLIIYSAITVILVIIFFIDLEHMIIPDGLNLILAILGITLNILNPNGSYKEMLVRIFFGFLLGFGVFFIFGLLGAMGGGDIKMMGALGLAFGWKMLIPLMFISFIIGGIIGIILIILKQKAMKSMIPFGPFISIATIIILFYGNNLVNWYLGSYFI